MVTTGSGKLSRGTPLKAAEMTLLFVQYVALSSSGLQKNIVLSNTVNVRRSRVVVPSPEIRSEIEIINNDINNLVTMLHSYETLTSCDGITLKKLTNQYSNASMETILKENGTPLMITLEGFMQSHLRVNGLQMWCVSPKC